jgi:hypothetical protein
MRPPHSLSPPAKPTAHRHNLLPGNSYPPRGWIFWRSTARKGCLIYGRSPLSGELTYLGTVLIRLQRATAKGYHPAGKAMDGEHYAAAVTVVQGSVLALYR